MAESAHPEYGDAIAGPRTAIPHLDSHQNGSVSTASAALSIASEAGSPTTGTTETTTPPTRIGTVATLVKKHPDSPTTNSRSMSHLSPDILRTSFVRAPPLPTAPWSSKQRPWGCAGRRARTHILPASRSCLLPHHDTQSLCQSLQGRPTSRKRLEGSQIEEAGESDEPQGARAPREAGRRERRTRRHGLGRVSPSLRRRNCRMERFIPSHTAA